MVEDVPADAELNELELRAAGISYVTRRVDTEAAFRGALGAFAPDIVLSDHSLPQFSAADTLRIALQESPDTPVIIVTGSLDEETAAEYIKAGATDYILKHHLQRLGPAVLRALEVVLEDVVRRAGLDVFRGRLDRKSTRLNSSHLVISYAVFCLKKK